MPYSRQGEADGWPRTYHGLTMRECPLLRSADWAALMMRFAILVTATHWLLSGKLLWSAVGITCAALSLLPRRSVRDHALRSASGLCLSTLLAAHVVLGMEAGLYETSAIYDKLIHALGSGAVTALVIAALNQYCNRERLELPLPLFSALALGIAVSAGTMWEVFEFCIDRTGLFQAQKGLTDTMLDLMADTVGAVATMGLFAWTHSRLHIRLCPSRSCSSGKAFTATR